MVWNIDDGLFLDGRIDDAELNASVLLHVSFIKGIEVLLACPLIRLLTY